MAQLPPDALAQFQPIFIPYPYTMREGCYNFDGAQPEQLDVPPTWMAACDVASTPSCNNGGCQAMGYGFFHPAFEYEVGCYSWHGGSVSALGAVPLRWGGRCSCGPPGPPLPPRIIGALVMGGIECPAGSDGARLNQMYVQVGQTADGRPYYSSTTGTHSDFLYYDASYTACNGQFGRALSGWIVGGRPNAALQSDLVSYCRVDVLIQGDGFFPPEGSLNLLWKFCGTDGAAQQWGAYAIVQNPPPNPSPPPPPPSPSIPPSSPPSPPPHPPVAFVASTAVSLGAAATAGLNASALAASLASAVGATDGATVEITQTSSLELAIPADADPASFLGPVTTSVCGGASGCEVRIAGSRRLSESSQRTWYGRRLQSATLTFEIVMTPTGGASLAADASATAALTSSLTSALSTALNTTSISVATPMTTATTATISFTIQGDAADAANAASTTLSAGTLASTLATSLGVDARRPSALP